MTCHHCRKEYQKEESRCPHCGSPNPAAASGLFQASTVMISTGGADVVYRSVEEVPARLRTKLLKSTNGANSATILIADRRGREEISKAMRSLPGSLQRRLAHSVLSGHQTPGRPGWLTPFRKKIIASIVFLMALTFTAVVLTYRG
ncbi:MAG TPA: hypothetical protein VG675_13740 [Bryobacteraceae bacterium]|nr:hypothetical protein [Bryobacteraceae bacterium]